MCRPRSLKADSRFTTSASREADEEETESEEQRRNWTWVTNYCIIFTPIYTAEATEVTSDAVLDEQTEEEEKEAEAVRM